MLKVLDHLRGQGWIVFACASLFLISYAFAGLPHQRGSWTDWPDHNSGECPIPSGHCVSKWCEPLVKAITSPVRCITDTRRKGSANSLHFVLCRTWRTSRAEFLPSKCSWHAPNLFCCLALDRFWTCPIAMLTLFFCLDSSNFVFNSLSWSQFPTSQCALRKIHLILLLWSCWFCPRYFTDCFSAECSWSALFSSIFVQNYPLTLADILRACFVYQCLCSPVFLPLYCLLCLFTQVSV